MKIAHGGWFPLVLAGAIFTLLATWRKGRRLLSEQMEKNSIPLDAFVGSLKINPPYRAAGTSVFMTASLEGVPRALLHNLYHNRVLHERVVLLSVNVIDVPRCTDSRRVAVERLPGNFWLVRVYYGFMEQPRLPEALEWCADDGLDIE